MITKNIRMMLGYRLFERSDVAAMKARFQDGKYFESQSVGVPQTLKSLMASFFDKDLNVSYSTSASTTPGVVFGTGTTPATADDYAMSGEKVNGFNENNVSMLFETNFYENYMEYVGKYTLSNTTGNDVIIGEIGIIDESFEGIIPELNTSKRKYPLLIAREAFDSPITIPAGGVGQITFTIRMNYPT